jgi:hypothetical protein
MLYYKFPITTKWIFSHPDAKKDQLFKFSTDLNKVGVEWDVSIKNGTVVDVISDPVTIDSDKYGTVELIKVKADVATDYHTIIKEFWVPVNCVVESKKQWENN